MRNRIAVCTTFCALALLLVGCAPDPALKKGEVIDRGVHPATPTETTPTNNPGTGTTTPPATANPK